MKSKLLIALAIASILTMFAINMLKQNINGGTVNTVNEQNAVSSNQTDSTLSVRPGQDLSTRPENRFGKEREIKPIGNTNTEDAKLKLNGRAKNDIALNNFIRPLFNEAIRVRDLSKFSTSELHDLVFGGILGGPFSDDEFSRLTYEQKKYSMSMSWYAGRELLKRDPDSQIGFAGVQYYSQLMEPTKDKFARETYDILLRATQSRPNDEVSHAYFAQYLIKLQNQEASDQARMLAQKYPENLTYKLADLIANSSSFDEMLAKLNKLPEKIRANPQTQRVLRAVTAHEFSEISLVFESGKSIFNQEFSKYFADKEIPQ